MWKSVGVAGAVAAVALGGMATSKLVSNSLSPEEGDSASAVATEGSVTFTDTLSATVTHAHTFPIPPPETVTVTETTPPVTTAPPVTTTQPPTTTTEPPPNGGTVAPGQSWQAAYDAAPSGSTVTVMAGKYGANTLSGSKNVTFKGQDGAIVRWLKVNGNNFTLDNVDVDGTMPDGTWMQDTILRNEGDNNKFVNLTVKNNKGFQMVGNYGNNGLFEDDVFKDQVYVSGAHMECIWSNGPGLTVRRSVFSGCQIFDLFLTRADYAGQGNVCCVTLEDNTFGPTITYTVKVHENADSIDRYTWKRNTFITHPPNLGGNPVLANSVFCGNIGPVDASWKTPC